MKKTILLTVPLLLLCLLGKSQCPGNVTYHASKMEMLDSGLNVRDSKDVAATVSISETRVMVHKSEIESDTMAGVVKKFTCDWREPYKNGKVSIIADIQDRQELLQNAELIIEAIDGKLTILFHAAEYPDHLIKLYVDKFEEDKSKK